MVAALAVYQGVCLGEGIGAGTPQPNLYTPTAPLLRHGLWQSIYAFALMHESRVTCKYSGMAHGFHCHLNRFKAKLLFLVKLSGRGTTKE